MLHPLRMVLLSAALIFGFPLIISYPAGFQPAEMLMVISSTLVIEYGAVVPAVALGLDLPVTLAVMCMVCLGVIVASFEVFRLAERSSPRVRGFLCRIGSHSATRVLQKYGIIALIPGMAVAGFYICPAAAWIIGWRRAAATGAMLAGFIASAILTAFASMGLLSCLFPAA